MHREGSLENELFLTLYAGLWTATCKMTGTDEDAFEAVAGGRTGTPPHGGGTNRHWETEQATLPAASRRWRAEARSEA